MKYKHLFYAGLAAILFFFDSGHASACNVCHSKNPKMVRMHQALEFKDCFACHSKGLESDPEKKKKQMETDDRCTRCHNKRPGQFNTQ